jgi:hypothetical protein
MSDSEIWRTLQFQTLDIALGRLATVISRDRRRGVQGFALELVWGDAWLSSVREEALCGFSWSQAFSQVEDCE